MMTDAHDAESIMINGTARYEPISEPKNETDNLRRRLNTYSKWNSKKSSLQLATAGFIYTGIADKVECQSCGIRLYNWQEDEDPLQAHKKYAPDCEFMLKTYPNVKAPTQPKKVLSVKYPHYSDYETRLRTFDSWPLKCVAQKPDMMAKSGFFYIGSADRARCFHCGVTLRDWDTDDYPPCAHRQWSESCPYVQLLDIEVLKEQIIQDERDEKLRIDFESAVFIDMHVTPRVDANPSMIQGESLSTQEVGSTKTPDASCEIKHSHDSCCSIGAVVLSTCLVHYDLESIERAFELLVKSGNTSPSSVDIASVIEDHFTIV